MDLAVVQTWDRSYYAGGCVGEPPQSTDQDDMAGTYITCYLVAAAALGATAALASRSSLNRTYDLLATSFFGLTSLSYGIAGLVHHSAAYGYDLWLTGASLCLVLASAAMSLLGVEVLDDTLPRARAYLLYMRAATIFIALLVMLATLITVSGDIATLHAGAVLTVMVALWALRTCARLQGWPAVKAVGAQVMTAGLAMHSLLDSTCGEEGYVDCWQNCPLPSAPYFNHSALSKLFICAGLSVLGVAMYFEPDLVQGGDFDPRVAMHMPRREGDGFGAEGYLQGEPETRPVLPGKEADNTCYQGCAKGCPVM